FFNQNAAYDIFTCLQFSRVLFRSPIGHLDPTNRPQEGGIDDLRLHRVVVAGNRLGLGGDPDRFGTDDEDRLLLVAGGGVEPPPRSEERREGERALAPSAAL